MAAGTADDDLLTAVRTHWLADVALAADVAAGPKAGAIPSPVPASPYAHVKVERAQPPQQAGLGQYLHRQRVTLTVLGKKADVVPVVGHVASAFEGGYAGGPGTKTLSIPNAAWMATEVEEPGRLERSPNLVGGDEVWLGVWAGVVWSQRSGPA